MGMQLVSILNRSLAAISPRDWPQYHAYIPAQKRDIINDIRTMFGEHIKHKFTLSDCKCSNAAQSS